MKKILFFDIDGTLYDFKNDSVPVNTRKALKQLKEDGHILVIATGRAPSLIPYIFEKLDIEIDHVIALNGQIVLHKDEIIKEFVIDYMLIDEIFKQAKKHDFLYGGTTNEGRYISNIADFIHEIWGDYNIDIPNILDNFHQERKVYQAHLYIKEHEEHHFDDFKDRVHFNRWHNQVVNVLPIGLGKSNAINWLINHLGIRHDDTIAFGDGLNDIDMLEFVKLGIAMGNSEDETVFEAADYITDDIDQDGLYKALLKFNILKKEV
jgi:Cof subfamily protein (haloacid dehalogenase superfamily)